MSPAPAPLTQPLITIEIDDHQIRAALRDLQLRVGDLSPAMHDIGQALVEGIRDRIEAGKDWEGSPFAPNRPVTLARKRGEKPLVERSPRPWG